MDSGMGTCPNFLFSRVMGSKDMDDNRFISDRLIRWYEANRRDLPWRETSDPYLIWISEVILQQTRVNQGLEYYYRFTVRFPSVRALAEAGEDEVMKYWQGLGYYSRARNLHAAAKQVMECYDGRFPSTREEVLSLKGIGEYTAAAICSFAFGLPYAAVDGNVYRVLSRVFGVDLPIDSGEGKKYFSRLAQDLLDERRPGLFNQAMMEFGALQCVPRSPDCSCCPLADMCRALAEKRVDSLPVKAGKTVVKPRYFNYLDIRHGNILLLKKRSGQDIWQNLYEFPLIETDRPFSWEELQETADFRALFDGIREVRFLRVREFKKHVLSHRVIYPVFYRLEISEYSSGMAAYLQVSDDSLETYAVSRLMQAYLEKEL